MADESLTPLRLVIIDMLGKINREATGHFANYADYQLCDSVYWQVHENSAAVLWAYRYGLDLCGDTR
jgi:hypothetical protein